MMGKTFIWGGLLIGSTLGSFIAQYAGGGPIAYLLWGAFGGFFGIYLSFKFVSFIEGHH